MADAEKKDLYVGWQDKAPPRTARFARRTVLLLLAFGLLLAGGLVASQSGFYPSAFEFGEVRAFEGYLSMQPQPMLLVRRPAGDGASEAYSHYYLVGQGKFGAARDVEAFDGRWVRLDGTLIYRDDQTMIEVVPPSVQAIELGGPSAPGETSALHLGTHTLVGEIVDSKCFFGVMKPGNLKPHRDCATRCISGGIPPVLVVRDTAGNAAYFLLQGAQGEVINQQVLDHIAVPLEITGTVLRYGDRYVLQADPRAFRRLDASS